MIPLLAPSHNKKAILKELEKTLGTIWIGQGPKAKEFEEKFAKKFGFKYCIAVNSGTSALELAYHLLDIKEGDEVISTVLTCTATNIPILRRKAKIVFCDIEKDTLKTKSMIGRSHSLKLHEIIYLVIEGSALIDNISSCKRGSDKKEIRKAKRKIKIRKKTKKIDNEVFKYVKLIDLQHYSYKVTGYPESVRIIFVKKYITIELNNVLQRRLFTSPYELSRRVLEYMIRKNIFKLKDGNKEIIDRNSRVLLDKYNISEVEVAIDITYSHGIQLLDLLRSAVSTNSKLRIEEHSIYYNGNKRRWFWKYYNKSLKDRIDNHIEPFYPIEGDVYRFEITLCRDLKYFPDVNKLRKLFNREDQRVNIPVDYPQIESLWDLKAVIPTSLIKQVGGSKKIKRRLSISDLKKSQADLLLFLSQNCIKPFKTFFDFIGYRDTIQFLKDIIDTTTLHYTHDNITKLNYLKLLRDILFKTRPVDLLLKSKAKDKELVNAF